MSVLIVDDDPDAVNTLSALLHHFHVEVRTCTYAKDAMHLVEEYRPEVILLDLAMPGMSGFEVAEELRHNPDIRPNLVVAVSGYGDEKTRRKTAAAGFDVHLVKPVGVTQLLALLGIDRCAYEPSTFRQSAES